MDKLIIYIQVKTSFPAYSEYLVINIYNPIVYIVKPSIEAKKYKYRRLNKTKTGPYK